MEERRLLVAVALSLVVLTAYSLLFAPAPPPVAPAGTPRPPAAGPAPRAVATPAPLAEQPPKAAPSASVTPVPSAEVADERERRVEVVGPSYTVAFTNRGARLVSWALTRQLDARGGGR